MEFNGLSRSSLQDAMLNRLGRISSLRKESKQHRSRLGEVRSELALLEHELQTIQEQLNRILAMPKVVEEPVKTVETGKVIKIRKTA